MVEIKKCFPLFISGLKLLMFFALIGSAGACIYAVKMFAENPCIAFTFIVTIFWWQNGWMLSTTKLNRRLIERKEAVQRKNIQEVNKLRIVFPLILSGFTLAYIAAASDSLPLRVLLSSGFGLSFWLIGFKTEYRFIDTNQG